MARLTPITGKEQVAAKVGKALADKARTIRMPGMRAASIDGTRPASTSPRARRSAHADGMSVSASTPSTAPRRRPPQPLHRRR